jgi:hypothetical protein
MDEIWEEPPASGWQYGVRRVQGHLWLDNGAGKPRQKMGPALGHFLSFGEPPEGTPEQPPLPEQSPPPPSNSSPPPERSTLDPLGLPMKEIKDLLVWDGYWFAELHRLRGVFLTAIGAEESKIEASFCAAINTAKG